MKIALAALFAASVATTGSAWAQDVAPVPTDLVPAGVPLRVALDKSYHMQVGTMIEGHLTEPVYLIDHIAIPADLEGIRHHYRQAFGEPPGTYGRHV